MRNVGTTGCDWKWGGRGLESPLNELPYLMRGKRSIQLEHRVSKLRSIFNQVKKHRKSMLCDLPCPSVGQIENKRLWGCWALAASWAISTSISWPSKLKLSKAPFQKTTYLHMAISGHAGHGYRLIKVKVLSLCQLASAQMCVHIVVDNHSAISLSAALSDYKLGRCHWAQLESCRFRGSLQPEP